MKTYLPFLATSLLVTLVLCTAPALRAQGPREKTPLANEMSRMNKDVRTLRKSLPDPAQKDACLVLAKDLEGHATKAKDFEPEKAKKIPADQKDAFIADYKKQMDGLIANIQSLETAISDGKTTDATALLDKLNMDKRDGHKKFNSDNH